jgi:hypothetical protein
VPGLAINLDPCALLAWFLVPGLPALELFTGKAILKIFFSKYTNYRLLIDEWLNFIVCFY